MINKIRQNKTRIAQAFYAQISLTPYRYNALVPAIVNVSNDVTLPFNSITSLSQHKETYRERAWMGPKSFWNLRIRG